MKLLLEVRDATWPGVGWDWPSFSKPRAMTDWRRVLDVWGLPVSASGGDAWRASTSRCCGTESARTWAARAGRRMKSFIVAFRKQMKVITGGFVSTKGDILQESSQDWTAQLLDVKTKG
jgi:hypothetical protein